jgi:ribosomal protein S12 methylthiotransferase
MARLLDRAGYQGSYDAADAQILIVNTCGFIGPAKDESLRVLGELAQGKQEGQRLIAAGCLTQRYGQEIVETVPGIDGILGTRRWMDIVEVAEAVRSSKHPEPLYHLPDVVTVGTDEREIDRIAIQGSSAYLKIADGCRRPCAFCAIPMIKGTAVSRPIELILAEAERLQAGGVRELILIAQDTTDYGHDLGIRDGLAKLLEQLVNRVPAIDWIRVMYAYPGYVTDRLIEVIAKHPQILPYLDIPLQHGNPQVLQRMRRPANLDWVHRTLEKMRTAIPELALRSTFIVGYPGESEAEFSDLLGFLETIRFDRVGAFPFSFEAGTASEPLGDPIPDHVKQERLDRLMTLQQGISLQHNQAFVGRTLTTLIEGAQDGVSLGRTYRDAPEVDGLVLIEGDIPAGEMVPVQITGAMHYDLAGQVQAQAPQVINP